MKNHLLNMAMALVFMLTVVSNAYAEEASSGKKIIKIAADRWCPINCTPQSDEEGIGIDLARRIFEPLGYTVDYILMPWDRALEAAEQGRIDAVIGAVPSEAPSMLFPKNDIVSITDDFFVPLEDTWKFEGVDSLTGKRLGIIKDYDYDEDMMGYIAANSTNPAVLQQETGGDALEKNIRKMLSRKLDVVVESRPVMHYMLRRLGVNDKVRWAGGFKADPVYLAFSPSSTVEVQQFDEGMARLKQSGVLTAMYERYGLTP